MTIRSPKPQVITPGSYVQSSKIEGVDLVLPQSYLQRFRKDLLADTSREYFGYLLCGHALIGKRLRLLACQYGYPLPDDYISHSSASIVLRPSFDQQLREECKRQCFSLLDLHTHPFSDHDLWFSNVDDRDEIDKFHYFQRNMPECGYGSIVLGLSEMLGRMWLPSPNSYEPRSVPIRIIPRDVPFDMVQADFHSAEIDVRFDRQVRAFGSQGQQNLSALKVGIVGVGGLGAHVALGLTRLGVRDFILIDPDRVEDTNLNRLPGMTARHLKSHPFKVKMIASRMRAIDRSVSIRACTSDLFMPGAWQELRDVDVIIVATDNWASRMLVNALAHQYLIPAISCGTVVTVDDDRTVDGHGHVYTVIPGQSAPCMLCSQLINKAEAYYELGPETNRRQAAAQGYIEGFDEPAPAVYHLNSFIASLVQMEVHNLAGGFKDRSVHLHYTMSKQRILTIEHPETSCSVCSPDGYQFARGDLVDPVASLFPFRTQSESKDGG